MNTALRKRRKPRVVVIYRYPPDYGETLYRMFYRAVTDPLSLVAAWTLRCLTEMGEKSVKTV